MIQIYSNITYKQQQQQYDCNHPKYAERHLRLFNSLGADFQNKTEPFVSNREGGLFQKVKNASLFCSDNVHISIF